MAIFSLLYIALGALYYYKERSRLFHEQKVKNRLHFWECERMRKISGDAPCVMPMVEKIQGLERVQKEVALFYLLFMLFSAPLAWYLTRLSLRPMRESIATIDSFINGIIHDINTPLSIIKVSAQSMQMALDDEKLSAKNARILQGIKDVESLEEQLLFALKSEHYVLQKSRFNVEALLQERLAYYNTMREKVEVSMQLLPLEIEADRELITRMIDNVVSNAVKFSPKDAKVDVVLKGSYLHVVDRGKGIVDTKAVFEKYYRENSGIKGVGLGLYVVKSVADMHGIGLDVRSKIGEGTSFSFNFEALRV